MKSPLTQWLKAVAALAIVSGALSSCSVNPNGPATSGASQGSLGSTNMSDYYYHKEAGWTYAYQNVENVYADADDHNPTTLTGANDTVRTMGYWGQAPSGDSLFRIAITYRVLSQYSYANCTAMDMYYVCKGSSQRGGFIDGGATIAGMRNMDKRPRPISTDTIVAGVIGRVRTVADNFDNTGDYVWQTDTLFYCQRGDSTYIWQYAPHSTTLVMERLLFCKDFTHNTNWQYNLTPYGSNTWCKVSDADQSVTVAAGTYTHCAKIEYYTPNVSDNMPITEYKWFGCGVGVVKEYDHWNVTTDGANFNSEDFTRTLISLTHN